MAGTYLRIKIYGFAVLFLIALLIAEALPQPSKESPIQELIRNRIEAAGIPLKLFVGDELVHSAVVLPIFYEERVYLPAWVHKNGPLPHINSLLKVIGEAGYEGLIPADYHLDKIKSILTEIQRAPKIFKTLYTRLLVDLELLSTDAFLIYGSHLLAGKINPEQIDPQWFVNRQEANLAKLLEDALKSSTIESALKSLLPSHSDYGRLRMALTYYQQIAQSGGWPAMPDGPMLRKGDQSDRIPTLRQRLMAEGFYEKQVLTANDLLDEDTEQALKKFQLRTGLEPDGILGEQTVKALNISAAEKVRQIIVNMERWRWLPRDLGNPYILVNIAGFNLEVVENGKRVLDMRIITGRPYRRTPVFSDKVTYLVMNPFWMVPKTIAGKDILSKVKEDPAFLNKQSIKVLEGWGANTKEIDPAGIDWKPITADNLKYRFRQDPGPQNALGRIKFMFPNQFDVYLHDTPSRGLFGKARRDFSSGCIRIEKPFELAQYLLRNDPVWPADKIQTALNGDEIIEKTVKLQEPVNIHILYWTVWVGRDELIHFSPDIYDRDRALDEAMQEPPPGA